MRISEMLTAIANWLQNPNNEAILLAEYDEDCLKIVAETCVQAAEVLKLGAEAVEVMEPAQESTITSETLDSLAEIAHAFDQSGDPDLKKSASAIDELLLTIAAPPKWAAQFKEGQENKLDILKKKYEDTRTAIHENVKVSDTLKAIENSPYSKEYRMMEHPLSSRGCPDHAGAQMARVGENMWQCDLDKKIYNYQEGYTDEKGNKIPGGDIANQTPMSYPDPQNMFDTRDTRLNGFQR